MEEKTEIDAERNQPLDWFLVFFIPLVFFSLLTDGYILKELPTFATIGVMFSVFGTYPNAVNWKIASLSLLAVCFTALFFGIKTRKKLTGKILVSIAFYLWCCIGFIGMVGAWG